MSNDEIKIAVISNIVFEPYLRFELNKFFDKCNKKVRIVNVLYEEYMSDGSIQEMCDVNIIVVILNFEELYPNCINDMYSGVLKPDDIINDAVYKSSELYSFLKNNSKASILWFGFEDYCYKYSTIVGNIIIQDRITDNINVMLNKLISEQDIFINLKHIIASVGISNSYDNKGKNRWNAPYSRVLISAISSEVFKQHLIHMGDTKKCIVLDCDNVLWGGILSEVGIENIYLGDGLGRSYQDFQRFLLTLYYHGVILAICSKNDEIDVLRVFREHSDMILKEENIACFNVNWNNKSENIKLISDELNIGLNSMVFIDDSEYEINLVRSVLPEVLCLLYDRDNIYDKLACFNLCNNVNLSNVEQRNKTYKTNNQRKSLQEQCKTHDEYVELLDTAIDIHETRQSEIARISELTQRTNKCTNGVRYTVEQIKQKMSDADYKLYSVFVSDKFSDLGLVGVIGINRNIMDLFSLSCRALGRNIEEKMFEFIKENNVQRYNFISTYKNDSLHLKVENYLTR